MPEVTVREFRIWAQAAGSALVPALPTSLLVSEWEEPASCGQRHMLVITTVTILESPRPALLSRLPLFHYSIKRTRFQVHSSGTLGAFTVLCRRHHF